MAGTCHKPPPLGQILETALYVDDLQRSAAFYGEFLGLKQLFADGRFHAYSAGDRNVLLLFQHGATNETVHMPGGTIPPHGRLDRRSATAAPHGPYLSQHIAFSVTPEAMAQWETALKAQGVAIAGRTDWPKGGHSIYFHDPDGHLLELATPGLWPITGS